MDWWSGVNSSAGQNAALAEMSQMEAAIFDPWIHCDDLDLSSILHQAGAISSSSGSTSISSSSPQQHQLQVNQHQQHHHQNQKAGNQAINSAIQQQQPHLTSISSTQCSSSTSGSMSSLESSPAAEASSSRGQNQSQGEQPASQQLTNSFGYLPSPTSSSPLFGPHTPSSPILVQTSSLLVNANNEQPPEQTEQQHYEPSEIHHNNQTHLQHHHPHLSQQLTSSLHYQAHHLQANQQQQQQHHHHQQQMQQQHQHQAVYANQQLGANPQTGSGSQLLQSVSINGDLCGQLAARSLHLTANSRRSSFELGEQSSNCSQANCQQQDQFNSNLLVQVDENNQNHLLCPQQQPDLKQPMNPIEQQQQQQRPCQRSQLANSATGSGNRRAPANYQSSSRSSKSNNQLNQQQPVSRVRRCRHITDFVLGEEERRLLIKEGYEDFPMNCQEGPLSKTEERILRKIRRKIRNKKSAQCSRQRKKEYVEELERKYANIFRENQELKRLLEQIQRQHQTTGDISPPPPTSQTLQTIDIKTELEL